jgi:predicted RNase H-like nuclease (RuvC/YqgF family)
MTRKNPQRTLKEVRRNRRRIYRFLQELGVTAKVRRINRRIERLEKAIDDNDDRVEELKEALRTMVRRYWAVCPADMD